MPDHPESEGLKGWLEEQVEAAEETRVRLECYACALRGAEHERFRLECGADNEAELRTALDAAREELQAAVESFPGEPRYTEKQIEEAVRVAEAEALAEHDFRPYARITRTIIEAALDHFTQQSESTCTHLKDLQVGEQPVGVGADARAYSAKECTVSADSDGNQCEHAWEKTGRIKPIAPPLIVYRCKVCGVKKDFREGEEPDGNQQPLGGEG